MTGLVRQTSKNSRWLASKFETAQSWCELMRVGDQTQARIATRISSHPRLTGALLLYCSVFYQNTQWFSKFVVKHIELNDTVVQSNSESRQKRASRKFYSTTAGFWTRYRRFTSPMLSPAELRGQVGRGRGKMQVSYCAVSKLSLVFSTSAKHIYQLLDEVEQNTVISQWRAGAGCTKGG